MMPSLEESLAAAMESQEALDQGTDNGQQQETIDVPSRVVEEPATGQEGRDQQGRFKPRNDKVSADQEPKSEGQQQPADLKPATAPAVQPTAHKAPVSWRPEVRGKFGALPPDIQEEVVRREREVEHGLREASSARRFATDFMQVMQPYEAMMRAEGATPLQSVQSLMNTAYNLRTAAPQQKAALVAQLIQQFHVDIEMLDEVLSGQVQPQQGQRAPQSAQLQTLIQQELLPVRQFMQNVTGMQQTAQTEMKSRIGTEIEQFRDQNEYYEDVREDMADLLEMSARRGQKMTLQQAYQRATMAHPTISKLIADKTLASSAQQRSSVAQRSRAASASLPSGGAPEQGSQQPAKPKDLESAVAASWDKWENRERD